MKAIARRLHLELIIGGYAFVLLFAAISYFQRHLAELQDPQGAMGSSGMWAFGDAILAAFVFCLLMIPTFFLIRFMAQSETVFAVYAKLLLAFSLTAPLCGLLLIIIKSRSQAWENLWVSRLSLAPCLLIVMSLSRILGRRSRSKRFNSYAVLIEGLTFFAFIGAFAVLSRAHQ
jgi:uncharacterized membrane protein